MTKRALQRARRELEREQQPRRGDREVERIAKVDEDPISKAANKHGDDQRRAELVATLDDMQRDLERVRALVPRVVAGADHRNSLRAIGNGLNGVRRLIDR